MRLNTKEANRYAERDGVRSVPGTPEIPKREKRKNLLWRAKSLTSLLDLKKKDFDDSGSQGSTNDDDSTSSFPYDEDTRELNAKGESGTILTIVLVEAKGLLDPPEDGTSHHLYCQFRLGSRSVKSKSVPSLRHPQWGERLKMHVASDSHVTVSLWDKGKHKNCMGSCTIDLSKLEKERTHEIWQDFEEGYGSIHFSVTMCVKRKVNAVADVNEPLLTQPQFSHLVTNVKQDWYNLSSDWNSVGKLYVKVACARGLRKADMYCTLELDNERVQTHVGSDVEPPGNSKFITFTIHDVTSTLDVKVHDSTLVTSLVGSVEGKVSIPLLRINNGKPWWYALKDRSQKHSAKGNCPRILLEMYMMWNPVKATYKLFRPRERKYIKKPPKFDIALIHSNLEYSKGCFILAHEMNEVYKRFLEWDNQELSIAVLIGWLVFWYTINLWTVPLMVLIPFFYHWINRNSNQERLDYKTYIEPELDTTSEKVEKIGITGKIQALPETTLVLTNAIEYMVSVMERINNLVSFKVPFLSYLAMKFLVLTFLVLYLVPFNYLLMALGIYKFTRKYLNPNRTPNNDLLDFISRIPDDEMLKTWKELTVPEPNHLLYTKNL